MTSIFLASAAARSASPPEFDSAPWNRGELVAESAWSRTYRAWPELGSSDSLFVAKVARGDLSSHSDRDLARSLIAREVEATRCLCHPHLATTLFASTASDELWLVQPTAGIAILAALQSAPQVEKLWAIRQVAQAIRAMHAAGWLHGNVSPETMVVSPDGHATLTELGWSRKLASEECDLAQTDFVGTVRYAAPELFDDHGQLTAAADIYSLGAVLYELLNERPLLDRYAGRALVAAKRMLSASELMPPEGEPYRVTSLLARMLAREPLRRPSAGEVIEALVAAEVESFREWANVA